MAPRKRSQKWLIRVRDSFISGVRRKRKNDTASDDLLNGSTAQNQQGLIIKTLHHQCYKLNWFDLSPDDYALAEGGASNFGVLLKSKNANPESKSINNYVAEPLGTSHNVILAAMRLDLIAAFTTSTDVTRALLGRLAPNQTELSVEEQNFVLPIFDSLAHVGVECGELATRSAAAKAVGVCLCRNERVALVWSDHAEGLIAHGKDVEAKFMTLIRASTPSTLPTTLHETPQPSRSTSKRHSKRLSWFSKAPSHNHASHASDEIEILNIPEPGHQVTLEPEIQDRESFDSEREFKRRYRRSWLPSQSHRRSWSASEHLGS